MLATLWVALLAPLAGCGFGRGDGGFFCSDPCGKPGQVRDFFCNCYVPESDPEGSAAEGLVFLEEGGQCLPTTAGEGVWVRNASPQEVRVVTRKEAWEGTERSGRRELRR